MEINEYVLEQGIRYKFGSTVKVYALDRVTLTFKTHEDNREVYWSYSACGELDQLKEISYEDYCWLNDEDPDYG